MTSLFFIGILLISVLITEKLLLGPIDWVAAFHLPTWITIATVLLLLSWLIGDS